MSIAHETLVSRLVTNAFGHIGQWVARHAWLTVAACCLLTAAFSAKLALTPQVSKMDGYAHDDARSKYEYSVFQEYLDVDGVGITVGVLIQARDEGDMLRIEYLNATVELLETISSQFPMFDADLGRNQSFDEFCSGFCQTNDPIKAFFNGRNLLSHSDGDALIDRVNLSYPTSNMFGRRFSLLPNFFGVSVNGSELESSKMIVAYFRAEKHPSWTKKMVIDYELGLRNYIYNDFNSDLLNVHIFSPAIVEEEVVRSGMSLQPFLFVGFSVMCVFCVVTTMGSAVFLYSQKPSFNKVILAIVACVNPFMACGTAMGILFACGVRHSPILAVTPFLVMAISVDDSFLMLHAWNRIDDEDKWASKKKSREEKMGEVLMHTGPAITISALTNILAFLIGAWTSPPEIQIFCYGNALSILIDTAFQATFYTGVMALVVDGAVVESGEKRAKDLFRRLKKAVQKLLGWYVDFVSNIWCALAIVAIWLAYCSVAVYGITQITVDLSSQKLFLLDSPIIEIDRLRTEYVVPYYTPATIIVNNPGDLNDPARVEKLMNMKHEFEKLNGAIGAESSKFFLDDYITFREQAEEEGMGEVEEDEEGDSVVDESSVDAFLEWPEFSFWKGFISRRGVKGVGKNATGGGDIDKFMWMSGYHGEELREWVNRGKMLKQWRTEVDKYTADFNATVFAEDGFYLDLLDIIPTITWQSAVCTFVCMMIVCAVFIGHPFTVVVVSLAILSTCLGVFGYLSLLGVRLDPIVMSISIMCIGFSVDIPAHVAFHFFRAKSSSHPEKKALPRGDEESQASSEEESVQENETASSSFKTRLEHTLASVGFPVIQAGVSTDLCALPLAFVQLYMANVFALAMTMCVTLSLIHGLVLIPAMFAVHNHFQQVWRRGGESTDKVAPQ